MDVLFNKRLEHVDGCAQEVVNAWAITLPAKMNAEFKLASIWRVPTEQPTKLRITGVSLTR
jgi:hypothetical protein